MIYTRENQKNHAKNVPKKEIIFCATFSVIFFNYIRIYSWVVYAFLPTPA